MQTHRLRLGGVIAAAVVGLAMMAACGDDDFSNLTPEQRAHAIRTLVQFTQGGGDRVLRAGHDTRVGALVTDVAGLPVEGAGVIWSTAQGSGSVAADASDTDADGSVRGTWTLGTIAGIQEVVATVDGTNVLDRNDVVVFPDSVVGSLTVASRASIVHGDTTRVLVTDARDRYGNAYVLTGTSAANPPPIEFTSLTPSILTLISTTSRSALVSGVAAGTGVIVARSDGKADTVTIQVTP
ncbi:MAG TPA: hypothetical protein VF092_19690 [Longimicrobium sp.]